MATPLRPAQPRLAKSSRGGKPGMGSRNQRPSSGGNNRPGGRNSGGSGRSGQRPSSPRPATPAPAPRRAPEPESTAPKELELRSQMMVRDLAEMMGCSPIELIKQLMNAGVMVNINQMIDYDTAAIVAEDMGFIVHEYREAAPETPEEEEESASPIAARARKRVYTEEEQKYLVGRPPVVTILGHVDHGKTSLLDVIRATNVQSGEAGGITQHIGAYQVMVGDRAITFLDTPGHEAFTAMRARGASVTDIAILVVAADDGVQPQTREAINHARAAQVPIIVAINKIDLATANPDNVKNQLAELGLVSEDWGGDTITVPVSARQKVGIDSLLDMVLLVAELADLKANPRINAEGAVIESRLDRARGATATLLVQDGTLKVGDALVIGQNSGKIRAMFDYQGKPIKRAGPSTPVVVIGLHEVPQAGNTFMAMDSEREARDLAAERTTEAADRLGQAAGAAQGALTLEDLYARAQAGSVQALNLILKADVQGSLEPIKNSLEKVEIGDLKVRFIHQGVGNVAESDIMLAVASQAIIMGFNVDVDAAAQRLAESEGIEVRTYSIIYRIIEDVQLALTGMLQPEYADVLQGQAVVRQVFRMSKHGSIAGVQVTEGKALRNATARVKRGGQPLGEGRVSSLKRFTEDVREVNTGLECGVGVDGVNNFEPDDVIEFYTRELVK